VKQARAYCAACREVKDVEILLNYEIKQELYTISEGPFEELISNLIVKCNNCQGLMIFYNATPDSIASETAMWPPSPDWLKGQAWSNEFDKLDKEALLASTQSEKARAVSQIFKLIFADHGCERKDYVSSFEALVEQKQLDSCFLKANKILTYLEKILDESQPEVTYNDMLDIQKFYLAVRSQLYETPALIRDFDEQWSGISGEFFGSHSS
jgi:hypothetical protein